MDQNYLEWKHWKESEFGQCPSQAGKYLSWHLRRAFPDLSTPLNVLEIGFGNGQIMAFCRARGFNITGVEASAHLVARAKASGYVAVGTMEDALSAAPFDLIIAFDVLEHLDSAALQRFFASLAGALADNGCLLVRVPNGDSPFGRRHQHGDLTHVSTFGEFKFRQIAQMWNLRLAAIGESPWYIDEFDPASLKSAVRGLLKASFELLFGFVFYRRRVALDANLVVVLKKAKDQGLMK